MIEVENISHSLSGSKILDDVSIQFPTGKVTALVGPNGAGKSSLLSILARLNNPDSGRVLLDGAGIHTIQPATLAQKLAILRQENMISSRLRVRDLVAFGRYPYHKGRPSPEDTDHVNIAIETLGLLQLEHRFLDELSGGQKQRAFIAMIWCQNTDYVLLDEPLNNLDLTHAQHLMRTIKEASEVSGKTTIIVLHDINYASRYADHIVGLKEGKLVFTGATKNVFNAKNLEQLFGAEIPVHKIDDHLISAHY